MDFCNLNDTNAIGFINEETQITMNIFCMKTCNKCEPEDGPTMPPASCEDNHPGCFLKPGWCQYKIVNAEDIKIAEDVNKNMAKLCPKTCNLCE